MNSFKVVPKIDSNLSTLVIELDVRSSRYRGLYPGQDVLNKLSRAGILCSYAEGKSIQWSENDGKVTASIDLERYPDKEKIMELCEMVQTIYTRTLDEFLTIMKVNEQLNYQG